jgi:ABC-2 type transport system permease protein
MTTRALETNVRVSTARLGVGRRAVDIWRHRDLLVAFVRTELKVKYKNSALGFFWSMLNPALYLVVFYVVFQLILQSGIPSFPIYLLSGLLVWNLFSAALGSATSSIVMNPGLVKKVAFPREVLPLATVGAALVHFFLQSIVLALALAIARYHVGVGFLPLLPFALFTLVAFCAAMAVLLSAVNVRLRDTAHFVELALLAWFWVTPIVYPYMLVARRLGSLQWVIQANPLVSIVTAFQRALYNQAQPHRAGKIVRILPPHAGIAWYAKNLSIVAGASIILFVVALAYFGRVEGDFAEEL